MFLLRSVIFFNAAWRLVTASSSLRCWLNCSVYLALWRCISRVAVLRLRVDTPALSSDVRTCCKLWRSLFCTVSRRRTSAVAFSNSRVILRVGFAVFFNCAPRAAVCLRAFSRAMSVALACFFNVRKCSMSLLVAPRRSSSCCVALILVAMASVCLVTFSAGVVSLSTMDMIMFKRKFLSAMRPPQKTGAKRLPGMITFLALVMALYCDGMPAH